MNTATGSYTGNGSSQSINVGWRPTFVIITNDRTKGKKDKQCTVLGRFTDDGSYLFWIADGTGNLFSNGIDYTSTGFDVGSDDRVNANNDEYYWTAFELPTPQDWVSQLGSQDGSDPGYPGTGGPDFDMVTAILYRAGKGVWFKTDTQSGDDCCKFDGGWSDTNDVELVSGPTEYVKSYGTDIEDAHVKGFDDGTNTAEFITGSYTGNGTSQTISLSVTPKFVMVCSNTDGGFKNDAMPSGAFGHLTSRHKWETSGFNIATNEFELTSDKCNENGVTYHYAVAI